MALCERLDPATVRELAEQGAGNRSPEDDTGDAIISQEAWQLVKGREDEVLLVAQSLAFVAIGAGAQSLICEKATKERSKEIHKLLLEAYAEEVQGPESFRKGILINSETVDAMLNDTGCRWLCCETAKDARLLGLACYSISNNSAMLRFLAVQPNLRGLCLGQRILDKVIKQVSVHAQRLILCIPSTRTSMRIWAQARSFKHVDTLPFPVKNLTFTITKAEARLLVYVRDLLPQPQATANSVSAKKKSSLVLSSSSLENPSAHEHFREENDINSRRLPRLLDDENTSSNNNHLDYDQMD